ncbi:MAG: TatD family hydrolase [Planctomycetota bacterium]|nr:TatD family hydrolase [Planctomycetota bacterium]
MWIDTHCHLNLPEFDTDRDEVRRRAEEEGVDAAILVGIDLETSRRAVQLAGRDPWFTPTVGVHPHDANSMDAETVATLAELAGSAAAIGETGLDYFRMHSPQDSQRQAFRAQVDLARQLEKPLIIHCREAREDLLAILKEIGGEHRGVMHCFSGDVEFALSCLRLGLHISFAGPVTYPKSDVLREVVPEVPEDRILLETDCPFLAPQPVRGRRNEPAYVRFTGEKVAHLRGVTPEEIARVTSQNARDLFRIPDPKETV